MIVLIIIKNIKTYFYNVQVKYVIIRHVPCEQMIIMGVVIYVQIIVLLGASDKLFIKPFHPLTHTHIHIHIQHVQCVCVYV